MMSPRLLDAGDGAFTIEFGDVIAPDLLARVQALDIAIGQLQAAGGLCGLIETMPTFRSLTVFFDPLRSGRAELIAQLQPLLSATPQAASLSGRHWRLPVCYEAEAGPDLADTAAALGLSVEQLVAQHSATELNVYMLGFLPGFPFMGALPAALHLPRRSQPRLRVPAGSVAIAGALTAIYPWQSPGGWHLLGRCPVPLFDATRAAPSLLAVGDRVRFEPVSLAEYEAIAAALLAGEIDASRWLTGAGEAPA